VLSFALLIAPIIFLFILNRDKYFIDGQGTDITVGGLIGIGYALLLVTGVFKDIDKAFSRLFGMFIAIAVVWFLEAVISDLFWFILAGIIGYVLYLGLSAWAKYNLNYAKAYINERARVDARADYEVGNV
jgi:hypothetical protein